MTAKRPRGGVGEIYSCLCSTAVDCHPGAVSACFTAPLLALAHQLLKVFRIDGHVVQQVFYERNSK